MKEVIAAHNFHSNNYTEIHLSEKEIKKDCKVIFDRVATGIVINCFENKIIIESVLKLNPLERIVIIFNIVNDLNASEISFLLGITKNNVYVQKNNGLKKLRLDLSQRLYAKEADK